MDDGADLVVERDPAEPLGAVTDTAADAELEERQLLLERATRGVEHDAGAQVGEASAGVAIGAASCSHATVTRAAKSSAAALSSVMC